MFDDYLKEDITYEDPFTRFRNFVTGATTGGGGGSAVSSTGGAIYGPPNPETGGIGGQEPPTEGSGFYYDPNLKVYINSSTGQVYDPNTKAYYSGDKAAEIVNIAATGGDTSTVTNRKVTSASHSNTSQDTNRYSLETTRRQIGVVQATDQTSSRTSTGTQTGTTNIATRERVYVDVPTPEEFLDDFRNGFSTYISGLRQQGGITLNQQNWFMENMDLFLGEYLGRLGEMAAQGQNIFQTVGVDGDPKFLGSREGAQSTSKLTGTTTTKTSGIDRTAGTRTEARSVAGESNVDQVDSIISALERMGVEITDETALRTALNGSDAGTTRSAANRTTEESALNSSTFADERLRARTQFQTFDDETTKFNTTTRFSDTETLKKNLTENRKTTEDIYERPNLAVVRKLSPLDYLTEAFPAASLNLLFEGQRGMRNANFRVGGNVSARRVG